MLARLARPIVTAVVAILALWAVHQCRARDRALAETAVLAFKLHAADSALQVALDQVIVAAARTDTVREQVTRYVARYAIDTLWRHDTVTVNGETRLAVPLATIVRTDSMSGACSLLAIRCVEERVAAERERDANANKIALLEARPEKSCRGAFLWGAGLGLASGGYVGVRIGR